MSECPFILLLRYYSNDQYRIKVIYMYRMDGFTSLNKFLYEMKIKTNPLFLSLEKRLVDKQDIYISFK